MSLELPDFKSELEEADWWYEHREEVEAEFVVAAAEGQLMQRNGIDHPVIPPIEVGSEDLERAGSIPRSSRQRTVNSRIRGGDLRRVS